SYVKSRIVGTGSYLPKSVVDNSSIASQFDLQDDDVFRVTGIRTRHWVREDEKCSDLAEQAARQALVAADLGSDAIDAILVSTTSPDMLFPSTACHLQRRLNARNVAAFDLAASCTGFIYGLSMADAFIRAGQFRCCLVVASEVKSRYLDSSKKSSAVLFGDGAGAAVLTKEESNIPESPGIVSIRLYSDGAYNDLISVPAGGSRMPTSSETVRNRLHAIELKGGTVFRVAVKRLTAAIHELLEESNLTMSDIQHVIAHQANGRMLAAIAKRLGIAPEHMFSIIEETGNTSSASLPMTLARADHEGKLRSGDLVLLGAFGGGLTWGTALVRWG
ncbi:MAG: beta-ketoacyl-ACP synthase III, partial [Nitrospirota bacterium]|nr:beta-ketoacyl-ACP synthase III [Nitrospirota bacterium]